MFVNQQGVDLCDASYVGYTLFKTFTPAQALDNANKHRIVVLKDQWTNDFPSLRSAAISSIV